ncbi:MAG: valine--tRNA ligase [Candidatus Nealsonbacteria bacterium]|nr:valine--tRNA ligase [Candidatus Nealsonbacteria bacterium]
MELPKAYEPKQVEDKIYKLWEESGFFSPAEALAKAGNPNKNKTFTILLPPPNITGSLHMGHALNATIQDILIRKKRMEGFSALWLPGTDHAGIATQAKVEKELKKEGLSRFDLGREKFLERVWEWKEKYGNIILDQLKKMGASCDWSRTRFTLDKEYAKAVETAFLHYHKKGWIYKGKRVVNWCPRCATSLSDLELEYQEEKTHLWYIRYHVAPLGGATSCSTKWSNQIIVATTRPETMLGDTAVAVNPKDERYKNLVGKKVILPIVGREIPIIADKDIDSKFGTGAVKVTPAHDLTDYEIGLRHNLEVIQVINEKGRMSENSPLPYRGLKTIEAREKIIEELTKLNLIEKIEDYTHQVPKCYRCNSTVELIPSEQWFLKMQELAKIAIEAVKSGKVKFVPKKWEKIYFDWLKNVRDWCISRQLWWGHKIPIDGVEDVLDTWFSSALWPFAGLSKSDLGKFYPTDVLSTARDIINLWVGRMIFSGMEFMGKEPFSTILIHPTVLTKEGQRMSKSLGTGIDPIVLIDKYGADATRFGIAYQLMGGQDIKFSEDNIMMGRKFCNKLWNASRFVLLALGADKPMLAPSADKLAKIKIIKQLNQTIKSVNKDINNYQFGKAAHTLYDFFWHDFCDIYIEEFKNQPTSKPANQKTLLYVLLTSLKLLHPFIPFITEEIYQTLPVKNKKEFLMIEVWPQ